MIMPWSMRAWPCRFPNVFEADFSIDCSRDRDDLEPAVDHKSIYAIVRNVKYGPKLGRTYAKIESIAEATGKQVCSAEHICCVRRRPRVCC